MKRLAVYMRVSTEKQETRMQRHAINEWLEKNAAGAKLLFFEDKKSGAHLRRSAFQKMLKAIADKKVDQVVVYRLDRLSRDRMDLMNLLLSWLRDGIDFVAVDQPLYQLTKDNPMRMTMLAVLADLAAIERETLSRRVKAGMAAAKAKGKRMGRKRVITTETQERIRELAAQDLSLRAIAAEVGVSFSSVRNVLTAN